MKSEKINTQLNTGNTEMETTKGVPGIQANEDAKEAAKETGPKETGAKETDKKEGKKNFIRKMYDWVLSWADKPSAQWMLFILAFAESSFFPVPPDILLIPLVLGFRKKWFRLAIIVTIGSTLGGAFGYFIGQYLWWSAPNVPSQLAEFFFTNIPGFSQEVFFQMQAKYAEYGFWIVFTAGFTPIPYKIFTISSGAFDLNMATFMVASVISRGARFFLVAFLIFKFGEPITVFIDKYFNWLALAATVLLIGGFIVVKSVA